MTYTACSEKKLIECTETCVRSSQHKHNHSYGCISLLYKTMLIKGINQDITDFKVQAFRHLSHIALNGEQDEHELAGSSTIKLRKWIPGKHRSKLQVPQRTSRGACSGSVFFYTWHQWAAVLAFGQCLCFIAWIAKHMSIVSAT